MDEFNSNKFSYEDEDSRDSGISCDSNSSIVSENISSNSSLNFSNIFNNRASPALPSNYDNQNVKNVSNPCKNWSNNGNISKPRTPLKNVTNCSRSELLCESSPISRKSSFRSISDRKRTIVQTSSVETHCKKLRILIPDENSASKPGRKSLHRALSVSQIKTKTFHCDSSPECSYSLDVVKKEDGNDYGFERIQSLTLAGLLKDFSSFQEKYLLIDCRYPYEYNGGHIKGAINLFDPEKLFKFFYPADDEKFERINSKIPIFYCEFSSVRGPNMANKLRNLDRKRNYTNYPKIDYKHIYVLEKGYQGFFNEIQCKTDEELCLPVNYTKMRAEQFKIEIKKYRFHKPSYSRTSSMKSIMSRTFSSPCLICSSLKCACQEDESLLDDKFEKISLTSPKPKFPISPTLFLPKTLSLDDSPPLNSNYNDCNS